MPTEISDLLCRCGILWDDTYSPPNMPQGPIRWLGKVSDSSELSRALWPFLGPEIWVAERDWPAITSSDLQRWLVDADEGDHLIILHGNEELPTSVLPDSVILLHRKQFSQMIGEHILQVGDFELKGSSEISNVEPQMTVQSSWSGIIGLNPSLRPDEILDKLGFTGMGLRPLHLQARLWNISGILVGPEEEQENHNWLVLEDPWCNELRLLQENEILEHPPDLEIQVNEELLSTEVIRMRLQDFLSERRASGLKEGLGTVLKDWRAVLESSEMSSQEILIPAWKGSLPGHGEALLHGLEGTIVEL